MSAKTLALDLIRIDGGTQMRAAIDQDTVAEYAAAWKAKAEFPPLVVFFDGTEYWLADGFHRYHGARAAKRASVEVTLHTGTQRDAQLFAAGANGGLRRSNADKRKAVESLLADAEWGKRSSSWIAQHCRVSDTLVDSMRKKQHPEKDVEPRVGKDGKERKAREQKPKTPARPAEPQQENFAPAAESQDDPPGAGPCLRGGEHHWGDEGDCEKCHEPQPAPAVKRPKGGDDFTPSQWEQPPVERMQGLHAEMRAALVAFKKPWNEAKEGQHGAYLQVRESRMAAAYQELWDAVGMAVPVQDCPKCDKQGCKFCAGTGWLSKLQATSLPKEARA